MLEASSLFPSSVARTALEVLRIPFKSIELLEEDIHFPFRGL